MSRPCTRIRPDILGFRCTARPASGRRRSWLSDSARTRRGTSTRPSGWPPCTRRWVRKAWPDKGSCTYCLGTTRPRRSLRSTCTRTNTYCSDICAPKSSRCPLCTSLKTSELLLLILYNKHNRFGCRCRGQLSASTITHGHNGF